MTAVQNKFKIYADPSELPRATVCDRRTTKSQTSILELQVNIEDQDHNVELSIDEIRQYVPSDPEVVKVLEKIASSVGEIATKFDTIFEKMDTQKSE